MQHGRAEHVFERRAAVDELTALGLGIERAELEMIDAVRTDRDAGRVQLAQTLGAHQGRDRAAWILGEPFGAASKPTADGIDGRRKAMPLQHRPGVLGEVVIGVVEGQNYGTRR